METLRADFKASLEEEKELILENTMGEESHHATDFCVVGRFLTNHVININAMKNMLADIWKLVMGVTIKNLGEGRFMFEIYHNLDVLRVMNGMPWTFNNHPLLMHHLQRGEYALRVPLNTIPLWVQVYDIPHGFMSEQFGNFLGSFLKYDQTNNQGAWRNYMSVRVNIDVSLPLKRFKSIRMGDSASFHITFRYERISTFCFMFGRIGHAENFCELKYAANGREAEGGAGSSAAVEERSEQGMQDGVQSVGERSSSMELVPAGVIRGAGIMGVYYVIIPCMKSWVCEEFLSLVTRICKRRGKERGEVG
ncbi:hypothetical protein ACS0TY_007024 [Phlomoides rotata]